MQEFSMTTVEKEFDPLIVGRRIRELRSKQGMNLEVLARAIERAPSQVSAIENGKRTPPIQQLQKIAQALGVSLNELINTEILSERSANELEIERAQRGGLYASLGLPDAFIGKTVSNSILEIILGLQREVERLHKLVCQLLDRGCNKDDGYFELLIKDKGGCDWYFEVDDAIDYGLIDHVGIPWFEVNIQQEYEFDGIVMKENIDEID